MIRQLDKKGFTLVELMLAMGLFSVILVVSTAGFIGINRTYTRGVIRKQLSESVQKISGDVSTLLQIQPSGTSSFCSEVEHPPTYPKCSTQPYNVLCFSGSRYYWPSHVSGEGGLYRDSNPCNFETFDREIEIVDPRYVVEKFTITPLTNELFQVKGIIHTANLGALTTSDNDGNYVQQRIDGNFDAYKTKCKGSSAGSVVQTCAVEKFDFIINSRGNK